MVPPLAGVEIAAGKTFSVQPTPDDLVDSWVNETSSDEYRPVVSQSYNEVALRYHAITPGLSYGFRAQVLAGYLEHIGYNSLGTNAHNEFSQFRLNPALRLGRQSAFVWVPRIFYHASDEQVALQDDPSLNRVTYAGADWGELYGETTQAATLLRLGQQSIDWNDGVLFSSDFWRLDPYLFRGLRVMRAFGEHYFDILAIRRGDHGELNGLVPADIFALKYDYSSWVSVFVANRDYQTATSVTPANLRGHRLNDIGVQSAKRLGRMDYKFSYLQQSGQLFEHSNQAALSTHAQMWEGGLGFYPLQQKNIRLGAGFIQADENFLPGYEPVYNLGYSQIFQRTNLRQFRGKLSYSPQEAGWSVFFEWIRSQSLGKSQLVKWNGDHKDLMDEADLGANWNVSGNLKTMVSIFQVHPMSTMSASSPLWSKEVGLGILANLQYTY